MTRDQLEHAIRAACDVSEDTELWIFGSQAILGEFPDAPKSLLYWLKITAEELWGSEEKRKGSS